MMVIRPRSVQEIVDALALARGAHRSIRVGDGTADGADGCLDISALSTLGTIDSTSRLVEVELGIRTERLIAELARAGFTVGDPVGPTSRFFYHYVAESPDLWRSPRAMTLRDRVVAVRGVLPDGAIFATRDSPRAANGPLVDRLLVGGVPCLVPAVLTHATLRLDAIPSAPSATRRAFRLPTLDLVMRLARRAWPQTIEATGLPGGAGVVVILAGDLPDFPECDVPTFDVPGDIANRHRRALWRDASSLPRPFWAYRIDRWGVDAVVGADCAQPLVSTSEERLLSALNVDGVLASVP